MTSGRSSACNPEIVWLSFQRENLSPFKQSYSYNLGCTRIALRCEFLASVKFRRISSAHASLIIKLSELFQQVIYAVCLITLYVPLLCAVFDGVLTVVSSIWHQCVSACSCWGRGRVGRCCGKRCHCKNAPVHRSVRVELRVYIKLKERKYIFRNVQKASLPKTSICFLEFLRWVAF